MKTNALIVAIGTPVLLYFAFGPSVAALGALLGVGVLVINGRRKTAASVNLGGAILFVLALGCVAVIVAALAELGSRL